MQLSLWKTIGLSLLWTCIVVSIIVFEAWWRAGSVRVADPEALKDHFVSKISEAIRDRQLGCASFALIKVAMSSHSKFSD